MHATALPRPQSPRPHAAAILLVALGAVGVQGCLVTTQTHDALVQRVDVIERASQAQRRELDEAREHIRQLQERADAAEVRSRAIADQAVRLESAEETLRAVRGSVTELQQRVSDANNLPAAVRSTLMPEINDRLAALDRRLLAAEQRVGIAPLVPADQIPADAAGILAAAQSALDGRDYNRARFLTGVLLDRFARDATADDARLVNARSFAAENRNANAVQEYRRIVQDFPQSDLMPRVLNEMAEAFVRLTMCGPAQSTLRTLTERFPQAPEAAVARRRIEEIRRLPRAACSE